MKRALVRCLQCSGVGLSTVAVYGWLLHATAQASGAPQTSPLLYAGSLSQNGAPFEGSVPIAFELVLHGATQVVCTLEQDDVVVSAGEFRLDVSTCANALRTHSDVDVILTIDGERFPPEKVSAVPFALEADHAISSDVAVTVVNNGVGPESLAPGSVTSDKVQDGSLTGADLQNASIGSAQLADGSVGSIDVADGAISSADLADGSIESVDIGNGTVASVDIADGTISSVDIADGTVASIDIADGAVTQADAPTLVRGLARQDEGLFQQIGSYTGTIVIGPGARPFGIVDANHDFPAGFFSASPVCVVTNGDANAVLFLAAGVLGVTPAGVTFRAYSTNGVGLDPNDGLRLNFTCVGR